MKIVVVIQSSFQWFHLFLKWFIIFHLALSGETKNSYSNPCFLTFFLLFVLLHNNIIYSPACISMEDHYFPTLHSVSKDSVILLSIPEPVSSKLHLFANIISMFDSWPINANKQRSNAEKLIRNYSSGVTAKSLFLISRKNEKETYERRFYDETNPNGLCGGISLFQLDQRHRHGYSATSSFRNKALDFHDSDSRNEFIKFLENIQPIQSSSESEEILSSVRAMIDWTQQKCFTSRIGRSSNKSPMIFPLEKWWHSLWYTEIHDVIPLTLLNNENDRSNIDLSRLLDSLFI